MKVNEVYEGDCLEVMKTLPDNCIDSVITDPPYNLTGKSGSGGFMGKKWDASGIAFGTEVWRECLRVAKPGATLMAFGGSRTHHRLVCAIEDAGWEIRDCIVNFHDASFQEEAFMASLSEEQLGAYLELKYPASTLFYTYGVGFPKSLSLSKVLDSRFGIEREVVGEHPRPAKNNGKFVGQENGCRFKSEAYITAPATPLAQQWDGWHSHGLKPAYESIVVAMKPNEGSYCDNALKWGVAGLNIDGGRVEGTKANGSGQPPLRFNGQNSRPFHENAIPRKFDVTKGRWPANVTHDGSDEVLREFAKAGVTNSSDKVRHNNVSLGNSGNGIYGKGTKYFEGNGYADTGTPARFFYTAKASPSERGSYNNHPTCKPISIMSYLVKITKTPTGGIVLDPFAGSGTTALACINEGRDYILIEKEPEYCEIIRRRIAEYTGQEIEPKEIAITEEEKVKQLALW